jgi:hypothetical protein
MKNTVINYLLINIVIALLVFCLLYFFPCNVYYKTYGFTSFLLISLSSLIVFLGVLLSLKLGIKKEFPVYLYCTLLKNGILLTSCFKYKEIALNIIFYLFFVYAILMILEIIFILKLSREDTLKNKKT